MQFTTQLSKAIVRGGRTILGYHKLGIPSPTAEGKANYVKNALFRNHLGTLRKSRQLPLDNIKQTPPTESAYTITFDDGYKSVFTEALPLLQETELKALVYLVSGQIGGSNLWDQATGDVQLPLMSEHQTREWLTLGHEIGSHTMTHPHLTKIPIGHARREIFESKSRLEQTFGVAVNHFCYPYGDWNEAVRNLVIEAGYHTAVTVEQSQVSPDDSAWALPRWMIYTHRFPRLATLYAQWSNFRCNQSPS